jgi:hypothetical protein
LCATTSATFSSTLSSWRACSPGPAARPRSWTRRGCR